MLFCQSDIKVPWLDKQAIKQQQKVTRSLINTCNTLMIPVLKVTRYICFKIRPLLHVSLSNFVARPSFKTLIGVFDQVAKDDMLVSGFPGRGYLSAASPMLVALCTCDLFVIYVQRGAVEGCVRINLSLIQIIKHAQKN